jgi:hypothetical protein
MSKMELSNQILPGCINENSKIFTDIIAGSSVSKETIVTNVGEKFIQIIKILNDNPLEMQKCYFQINQVNKKYPPQKNEMKFIYGKIIEMCLLTTFCSLGFECIDLDKKHNFGSEYKNDISIMGVDISIKAKLNQNGNIIMINKLSKTEHEMKIETLVCSIKEGILYFIPSEIVDNIFITTSAGCILYKGKILTMIKKNYPQYVYKFPKLTDEQLSSISQLQAVDLYKKVYDDLISGL